MVVRRTLGRVVGVLALGLVLAAVALALASGASAAATGMQIGLDGSDAVSGNFFAYRFSVAVLGAPSKPSIQWTIKPPSAIASCNHLVDDPLPGSGYQDSVVWLLHLADGNGTAANGCPSASRANDALEKKAVVTVTVTASSQRCTASFVVGEIVLGFQPTPACGTAPGNGTTTSAKPSTTPSTTQPKSTPKTTDRLLRQAAQSALTFELRQLPVLMKKPWLRKAIATRFSSKTRAMIDKKLAQEKAAKAERARTHARLQRELRQGWKKVWDVRAELESYKDLCNRYVDAYDTVGKYEVIVSAALLSTPGGALFVPLTAGLGGAARIAGSEWARNAADPPDPHFRTLVRPVSPTFAQIPASGPPAGLAGATAAFLGDDAKAIGLVTAFRRSFERAQGAAAAGNATWTARQLAAAARFAASAGAALSPLPTDLTALRKQLAAADTPLKSAQTAAEKKLGGTAAPGRLLPQLSTSTTKTAAALRTLAKRLKALATA